MYLVSREADRSLSWISQKAKAAVTQTIDEAMRVAERLSLKQVEGTVGVTEVYHVWAEKEYMWEIVAEAVKGKAHWIMPCEHTEAGCIKCGDTGYVEDFKDRG